METREVNGVIFRVIDGKYKCECGRVIVREHKLDGHIETKSHRDSLSYRQMTGNTAIFRSLLTPNKIIIRK
jgi:hypothetical protein